MNPSEALVELNAWRAEVGVAPIAGMDPEMSEGCALHDAYLAVNPHVGSVHEEEPSLAGFTDLGNPAATTSVLINGEVGPRAFEAAVYHRLNLLEPRMTASYFAAAHGFTCIGAAHLAEGVGVEGRPTINVPATRDERLRTASLVAYPFPPNNDKRGVPVEFTAHETPNPAAQVPGTPAHLGYLLSVQFNGPWETAIGTHVEQTSLKADGASATMAAPQDTATGLAPDAVGLFPTAPLAPDSWYTAHVAGYIESTMGQSGGVRFPFDVTWRFQTGQQSSRRISTNAKPQGQCAPSVHFLDRRIKQGQRARIAVTRRQCTQVFVKNIVYLLLAHGRGDPLARASTTLHGDGTSLVQAPTRHLRHGKYRLELTLTSATSVRAFAATIDVR